MRRLGYWEATCEAYHRNFSCSGMILQVARVYGPLDAGLARDALRWLQRRHPLLQVSIVAIDDDHDGFSAAGYASLSEAERLDALPLRVSTRAGDEVWKEVVDKELSTDFAPTTSYLWRAHILAGEGIHDCIFLVHHAIGDGTSCAILVRDFLTYCAELRSHRGRPKSFTPLPLLLPVEAMIPAAPLGDELSREAPVESEVVRPWPLEEREPLCRRTTRALYHTIEAGLLKGLRSRSRERGATLGSLLTAALMTSSDSLRDAAAGIEGESSVCATAISLRDRCRPAVARDHFGCYVMVVNTHHCLTDGGGLWELARGYQASLRVEIERRSRLGFMPRRYQKRLLAEGMIDALIRSGQRGVYQSGPLISNIGALDFGRAFGDFRLGELYFCTTQNAGHFNAAAWVATHNGRSHICYTYTEGLETRARATSVFERMIDIVRVAGR